MKTFSLNPKNGQKSFYGKCHVNEYINSLLQVKSDLISYSTKVATYNHDTNEIKVFGYHSATTGRNINAFLEFYGFDPMSKKELFKKFNLKK